MTRRDLDALSRLPVDVIARHLAERLGAEVPSGQGNWQPGSETTGCLASDKESPSMARTSTETAGASFDDRLASLISGRRSATKQKRAPTSPKRAGGSRGGG